jgi:hypothetical protein
MPRISEFLGIIISMFYKEHSPPHFHAEYAGKEGILGIDPISMIEGQLPPRVRSLVVEWAAIYQEQLRENWELARNKEILKKIPPLE